MLGHTIVFYTLYVPTYFLLNINTNKYPKYQCLVHVTGYLTLYLKVNALLHY